MEETISIIVPIFNAEKYIRDCIDSLLAQTYHSIEVLLVDDGSTDESGVILDEYARRDTRIKVLRERNLGVSAARNLGISQATGTWITFVDADDWIDADHVRQLLLTAQCEMCDCAISGYVEEYPDTSCIRRVGMKRPLRAQQAIFYMLRPDYYQGFLCNKLFRRSLIEENGLKLDESLFYLEDIAFCAAYFSRCRRVHCAETTGYHYRQHTDSAIRSRANEHEWIVKRMSAITALERAAVFCVSTATKRLCAARRTVEHTQILRYLLTDVGKSSRTMHLLAEARGGFWNVAVAALPIREKVKYTSTVLFPNAMSAVWVARERQRFRGLES